MTERSVKSNRKDRMFMIIPFMMILLIVTPVAADSVLNNWTEATGSAAFSARSCHSSVVYDNKMWVIAGSGASLQNDVWYSTNGETWIPATSSAGFSGRCTQSVVYDGKMWVIGGNDGGSCNDVWYSTDGANWTQATAGAAWSARYYHQCVVYDDKMWVIGGYAGGDVNDVWYSTDGANWTQATAGAAWPARCGHQAFVYDEKMWVLGGYDGKNDVWYSTDGATWTQATAGAAWPARYYHQCVVYDDKMWVIGGYAGGLNNDVWYSTDGATWTQAGTSTVFSERQHPTSVAYDGRMWIIGGNDGSFCNDVWYTTIGDTSSTVSIETTGVDHPGDETTVVLTMDSVSNGLSGYNLEISLENSSIAEFTGVIFPEWADDLNDHGSLPSSQNLLIKASDVGYLVEPGESNITLATLTVKGLYPGISGITISNTNFDDDDGNDIGISVVTGNFTVTGFSAPVVSNITPCGASNQETVNVTITGSNFMDGGSVILRNANFINISGNDFTFVSGSEIGCSFNLTGATPGNWSVIVTNSDGQSGVLENGFLVSVVLVPIEGQSEMPTDPNSDGLYEDLNGNLEIDYADVNLFFDKLDWMRANEPVSAFDFVPNGELGIGDIIALFDMIS